MLDGYTLDIELANGNTILFSIKERFSEPAFSALLENDKILFPQTDGESVFWCNGPRITIDEVLEILIKQESRGI